MEETLKLCTEDRELAIILRYGKRRTLGITVTPQSEIKISAPEGLSHERILQAVTRRMPWILKQLKEFENVLFQNLTPSYESGQTLRYLGRDYMLRVNQIPEYEEEQVVLEHRILRVDIRDREQKERINLMVEEWYRNEALVHLGNRFEELYQRIKRHDIPRPQYYLRRMDKRWGSCTPTGIILLNPEMIQLPVHCIDYAIMHELCHLKYRNHSKDYYYFLDTVMPDWKERERDLLAS